MLVVYRQRRDRTENSKMLVAYREHREQRDASSLQTGQRTTRWLLLTNNTGNNEMFVPYRRENNRMLVVCRQNREQRDVSSLQATKGLFVFRQDREQQMLVACRQHWERRDARSLQTGQRTAKWLLLTNNVENNEMLVPYRQDGEPPNGCCLQAT